MPVEIRELVIRATVDDKKDVAKKPDSGGRQQPKQDLVAECVEQVLRILRRQRER